MTVKQQCQYNICVHLSGADAHSRRKVRVRVINLRAESKRNVGHCRAVNVAAVSRVIL